MDIIKILLIFGLILKCIYKVAELTGHMNRVLYMCISPDDITLANGASDETLRFWIINDREKVNEMIKKKKVIMNLNLMRNLLI